MTIDLRMSSNRGHKSHQKLEISVIGTRQGTMGIRRAAFLLKGVPL